jgi:hypothetical protein
MPPSAGLSSGLQEVLSHLDHSTQVVRQSTASFQAGH